MLDNQNEIENDVNVNHQFVFYSEIFIFIDEQIRMNHVNKFLFLTWIYLVLLVW